MWNFLKNYSLKIYNTQHIHKQLIDFHTIADVRNKNIDFEVSCLPELIIFENVKDI